MALESYAASKPRYEILDGLRGVAAMTVVVFHLFETYAASASSQIINHGYLAVDFFFVLSGFVVGYAYDDRWDRMSIWDFFKRRLVRLHPMVIMGTVLGACFYFFGQGDVFPHIGHVSGWKVLAAFVMGCLMIPCGPKMDIRGWGEMNSFNGPNWSLTWEYLANILYAFVFRRLSLPLLGLCTAVAGFCTLDLCLDMNVWGLLSEGRSAQAYTVIGGWSLTPEQLYIGATRLFYPFLCGLLLSRVKRFIKVRGGFWWCAAVLVAALAFPCIGRPANIFNGAYNAACIMLVFPLVVVTGAGSALKGKKSIALCNALGEISYPLYITHYPLIYMQTNWAAEHPDAPLYAHIMTAAGVFVLSVLLAWACLKLYDIPVRRWLTERFLTHGKRSAA
ncbi:MAG: acyltransferase [Alistipes sp.]|nr:acyltransferase [Alistipes sp.]